MHLSCYNTSFYLSMPPGKQMLGIVFAFSKVSISTESSQIIVQERPISCVYVRFRSSSVGCEEIPTPPFMTDIERFRRSQMNSRISNTTCYSLYKAFFSLSSISPVAFCFSATVNIQNNQKKRSFGAADSAKMVLKLFCFNCVLN